MFVLANLITAMAHILDVLLTLIYWLVIIRAVISWVNPDPDNTLVQLLYKTTEPILEPIRRRLPLNLRFGIDISPVILILVIMFLQSFLIRSLFDFAVQLRLRS